MTVRIFAMASPKLLALLATVNCVVVYRALGQTFQVLEGIEDKKFIGSVAQSSELQESIRSLNLNLSQLQYTIFSTGNPQAQYFVIDDSTGAVYTDGSLDREVLCGSEVTPCTVQLDVSVHNKAGFLKILNVQIIVGDVNDNSPVFPNSAVSLQISESEPVGSTVTFRGASDRDSVGVNSEISYELTSPGSPFELSVISYPDRTQDVVLRVARALDRELVPSYQLQIVARDGGEPQKTGTAVVDVVITDVNDNYPEFSQKVYSVTIREDLAPNTPVLQVSAQDLDSGDNGKVMYRLSTPTNAFFINATSGSVIVGENVDFEQKQVYRLMVEASDSGAVPKTRKAQVVVNVSDVNDNSPEVSFNFLPPGDHAVIPEHSDLGTFVAYMSVSDKDQGQNALVKCSMQGTRYTLESQKLNEYKIKLLAELDREVESGDYVSVVCVDSGRSPRTATAGFSVVVQDVNDHSPILPKQQYSITVQEGLSVGTVLLNVSATDKDFGENGRVSYRIHGERAAMFAVSDTGVVWLNLKLDREQADTITVNLVAEDHGSPSKSTNATIIITITDINDEKPVFSEREYRLNITENSEGETVIGQVVAEDSDLDEGGQVRYKLTSNYDSQFFSVSPDTGVITAKSPLDRENRAIRELVVIAVDQGEPSLSSSVAVFIKVLDLNDNTPVISFPAADNYSLSIPSSLPAHSEVVTVVARDKDEGENARLTYILLEQGRMPEYFRINQTSGRINLVKEIRAIASNVYKLSLTVRDNGIPQRETIRNFRVHVTVVNETAVMSESESGKYNVVIVISVIAMTAVLSAVILGTICIIRRRDSKQVETSNIRPDLYDPPPTRKTEHKNPNVGEIVRGEKMYEARAVPVHKVPPVQSPEIPLKISSPKDLPPYSKATEQQHLQYIRDFFPSDSLDLSTVSSSDQSRQARNTHWQDQPPNVKAADCPRRSSQRQPNSSRKQHRPNRVQWALEPESGPGGWGSEHTSSGELQILPHPDLYGQKPDDSTSDLSGDPSDSGRGGSDDDVHRGYCLQIEHEGVHGHYV